MGRKVVPILGRPTGRALYSSALFDVVAADFLLPKPKQFSAGAGGDALRQRGWTAVGRRMHQVRLVAAPVNTRQAWSISGGGAAHVSPDRSHSVNLD